MNGGHGHVKRRPDGALARCGGPGICHECSLEATQNLVTEQPAPVVNDKPAVWGLVVADMVARDAEGRRKYGTPLQPHNGRDALVDLYQELLDAVVYARQAIFERDGR